MKPDEEPPLILDCSDGDGSIKPDYEPLLLPDCSDDDDEGDGNDEYFYGDVFEDYIATLESSPPPAYGQELLRGEGFRQRILHLHGNNCIRLADVVRDHVLHHLPVRFLLQVRAVASSWARLISSPIFAHSQSRIHRSISGVFCRPSPSDKGPATYVPFPPAAAHSIPDPALSFLPAFPVAVRSSCNGLALCYAPDSLGFYVCNPATAAWAAVPHPPIDPGPDPAAVLIFVPSVYNFRAEYSIVIACEIGGARSGIFGFQTFSSEAGEWWVSSEACEAERLHPDSGVAAGSAAYWRTTMLTVVEYHPAADRVRVVPWPMGHSTKALWEIGEMDGRLCCAAVTKKKVLVYKILNESDGWALVGSMDVKTPLPWRAEGGMEEKIEEAWVVEAGGRVVFKKRPWPLRFQGGEMEVLLWVARGAVVGVHLATKRVRWTVALGGRVPGHGGSDYVPYISTLAPVSSSSGNP